MMTTHRASRLAAILLTALFVASTTTGYGLGLNPLSNISKESDTQARSSACVGDVCISEVLVNAFGSETDAVGPSDWTTGEWVEIHNAGTSSVDLASWTLHDHYQRALPMTTTNIVYPSGATGFTVAAGDYIILGRNGDGGACGMCLKNTNGVVELQTPSGTLVHSVTWTNRPTEGSTLIEDSSNPNADWVESVSMTPGATNGGGSSGPIYHDTGIRVREILADPFFSADNASWPGGEWLELENIGTSTVDLAGYYIMDSSSNNISLNESHLIGFDTLDPTSTHIQPGSRKVVAINSTSDYGVLNNGGDQLAVFAPNGSITDELTYPSVRAGHSKIRSLDGLTWTDALFPTPGETDATSVNGTSSLTINEILVNGTVNDAPYPDGEWIELRVHSEETTGVGLTGHMIKTGTGGSIDLTDALVDCSCTIVSPHGLGPGEYGVIQLNGTGVEIIRTLGDTISLIDLSGKVVQTVTWATNIPAGRSMTPIAGDPVNGWTLSSQETPAAANPDQTSGNNQGRFDIQITEILPNPFGNDSAAALAGNGEFIELWNNGTSEVDLSGWSIISGSTLALNEQTTSDMNLDSGERVVIRPTDPSTFWLSNTAGSISLHDALGNPIDSIVYSSTLPGAAMVANLSSSSSWIYASSPTPGTATPTFDNPYVGSNDLVITEIMVQCGTSGSDSVGILGEWVELRNNGTQTIDLSRWHILDEDGTGMLATLNQIWNGTSMNIAPGEHVVLRPEEAFMDNFGDTIRLMNPDGTMISTVYWLNSQSCISIEPRFGWGPTLMPSPGMANPVPDDWDGTSSVIFSRIMVGEVNDQRDHDWFEIRNIGTQTLDMSGWMISRHREDAPAWNDTFRGLILGPGESAIITGDPVHLLEDAALEAYGGNDVMYNMPWLPDSGGGFQLVSPTGVVVDTIVYGDGDPNIEGWTGPSITPPSSSDPVGLIMMRGDGCASTPDAIPDTDSAADWEVRWLRMGASLFCDGGIFSTTGTVTTSISPGHALGDLVEWINAAESEIHVHLYEFTSYELSRALRNALDRGVEVTVLLEGDIYSSYDNMEVSRGIASDLHAAGATVLWMVEPTSSTSPESPYKYIHSKAAVRDASSVWISSGNWKSSSLPLDGDSGNRDWSIFIDSEDIAQLVLSRMIWDENTSHLHIEAFDPMDYSHGTPAGWTTPIDRLLEATPSPTGAEITHTGAIDGKLLTCPDDCIGGLVDLIDSADNSIDLSLQYFQDGWGWGYGDNPLIAALERATLERNVTIRLLLNGYYTDDPFDDRDMLSLVNNDWNRTLGADATAILMSQGGDVTKLHNKGMIIDGESVLVSSINWGSNSALRNREMGIVINEATIAGAYLASFEEDWNRLDGITDTDGDGMIDRYEMKWGLNRTSTIVDGSPLAEQSQDWDGDGLSNLQESNHDSDPFSKDTDGDCIDDPDELAFAAQRGITNTAAMNLADADGDGYDDNIEFGCSEATATVDDTTPSETNEDEDDEPGGSFGLREDPLESNAAKALLALVIISGIALGLAVALMLLKQDDGFVDEVLVDDAGYVFDSPNAEGDAPGENQTNQRIILAGTSVSSEGSTAREAKSGKDDGVFGAPQLDAYNFPGWTDEEVQSYLAAGWTVEQLQQKHAEEHGE